MENYESNSRRSKEAPREKKVEKVVSHGVNRKKKSLLADIFAAEDLQSVGEYVVLDVLIPAFKKAISEMVSGGIDMLLYGDTGKRQKTNASHVSYRSYYDGGRSKQNTERSTKYGYEDIVLDDRSDAEEVLTGLDDLIECYGVASVADLCDLLGIDGGDYTDNYYGWKNLRSAKIMRTRDGYLLKLPKAIPIN